MNFGYTNRQEAIDAVRTFRDAAISDGWDAEASYQTESFDRAATLDHMDGYKMQVITREKAGKWKFQANVSMWGPDGLSIFPPDAYCMSAIHKATKTCLVCKEVVDKVFRYSFAGRACVDCIAEAKASSEKPGWND